jgi:hypothetical protein
LTRRSKTEIAQAYGILLSTLSTYLKNWDCIENQTLQGAEVSKRMRICGAKHSDLEDELFEWFCHARTKNIPVEDSMVKEKVNEIALKMLIEFQCSNGWLQQFKQRQNIRWQAISGESLAADVESSDTWRESVVPITEQYAP